jgi:predicted ATPase
MINNITINRLVNNLKLNNINVLIGANGSGKSLLLKEIGNDFNARYYDLSFNNKINESVKYALYHIYQTNIDLYQLMVKTIQLNITDFIGFEFKEIDCVISLFCIKKWTNIPQPINNLSDGELRFINLVILINSWNLDPHVKTLCLDNPELGLHPYAINVLGALLHSVSDNIQIIISTQSVTLLNEFDIDDIIVVENKDGKPEYKRLNAKDYENWLKEYSVSELWYKNVLGGRP